MRSPSKKSLSGFTLIETVIAMAVITMGLFGTMSLFYNTVGTSMNSHLTVMASSLVRERLEKIIFDKKMQGYDFVQIANYTTPETFTGAFAPFTRTTQIQEVDSVDLTTPRSNTDYKRITVTVSWTGGNQVRLATLVTRWGVGS